MLFATAGQGWVFVWMIGAGALIGAWYALLAGVRRLLSAGFWLSLMADVAFGAGAAAIFCAALVAADWGRLRLYAVLGTLVGFALFAAACFTPARAVVGRLAGRMRHFCGRLRDNRWIKVIFR